MKLHDLLSKIVFVALWFCFPLALYPQTDALSLKHGTYVRSGASCRKPPFAAVMSWDGHEFSGPHSSKCTSRILSQHGNQYSLSTTCVALGDGTPDTSGYVESFSLTRLSAMSFLLAKPNEPQATYRWCTAK